MEESHIKKFYAMHVRDIYPAYVQKAERKGRTASEVDTIISWLTGYELSDIKKHIEMGSSFERFFAEAPKLNDNVSKITGMICGYRVEEIEEPLVKKVRYLDKLIDELAKGKDMAKILRT